MEVDLHTDTLGSVRLHGIVTDFADFYSAGGLGAYDGQARENTPFLNQRTSKRAVRTSRFMRFVGIGLGSKCRIQVRDV